jgi:hypothetical protein
MKKGINMEIKLGMKLLGGLFCMAISLFIASVNLLLIEDIHAYRLSLTIEGCGYAQSIDLPIEKNNGQCSVITRFAPYAVGTGGVLYLDNGKTVSIADTMLLATAQLDAKLPLTPIQRERLKWAYVWFGIAISIGCMTFIYWRLKK